MLFRNLFLEQPSYITPVHQTLALYWNQPFSAWNCLCYSVPNIDDGPGLQILFLNSHVSRSAHPYILL